MSNIFSMSLIAMALAGVASVFVLVLYRRAVGRVMRSVLNAHVQEEFHGAPAGRAPLLIADEPPVPDADTEALYHRMRRGKSMALRGYVAAGAAATLVLAPIGSETGVSGVLQTWVACFIGLVPILALVGTGKRRVQRILIVLLVVGVCSGAPNLTQGEKQSPMDNAVMVFVAPIIFFVLVLNRYLRTVAPMLLMVTAGGVAGVATGQAMGDSVAIMAVLAVAGVVAGVLALQLTVRAYERKRTSDRLLLLDMYWLLVAANFLAVLGGWGFVIAIPAAIAYRGVLWLFHWRLRVSGARHEAVELLLLRTFGSRGRSERLMEEIGFWWRHIGPIHLIGGPDLATANLDPAELWQFLRGRTIDLAKNAVADVKPDRDGRYRVNDFFCFDDTWRNTMASLVDRSHVVLLDARDFQPRNEGVKTELQRLLARKALGSLVVIVDSKHEPALRTAIDEAWQCVDPESVNVASREIRLRVVRVDGNLFDAQRVLYTLASAAAPHVRGVAVPSLAIAVPAVP
jgi:hypothetical protein